jgi:hypothetical protein
MKHPLSSHPSCFFRSVSQRHKVLPNVEETTQLVRTSRVERPLFFLRIFHLHSLLPRGPHTHKVPVKVDVTLATGTSYRNILRFWYPFLISLARYEVCTRAGSGLFFFLMTFSFRYLSKFF